MTPRQFRNSATWRRLSKAHLARHPICQYCEAAPGVEMDQIQPIERGGARTDRANLAASCRSCHASKTQAMRYRQHWTPPIHRGCDEHGRPRDPAHPWHGGGIDRQEGRAKTDGRPAKTTYLRTGLKWD